MRNTPYPRHSIGHGSHKLFELDKTIGVIQGIVDIKHPIKTTAQELQNFSQLPTGEVVTFAETSMIEVFEFGGYHGHGAFIPELSKVVVKLEPGAKITGPAVWRTVPDVGDQIPVAKDKPHWRESIVEIAIILGCLGLLLYISPLFAAISTVFVVVLSTILALMFKAEGSRLKSISKLGSVYVYAPSNITP